MRPVVGALLILGTLAWWLALGTGFDYFWHLPSFFVATVTLASLVALRHGSTALVAPDVAARRTLRQSAFLLAAVDLIYNLVTSLHEFDLTRLVASLVHAGVFALYLAAVVALVRFLAPGERAPLETPPRSLAAIALLLGVQLAALVWVRWDHLSIYWDHPSLTGVILVVLGALLIRHPGKELIRFEAPVGDTAVRAALAAGTVGALVGTIQTLQNVTDPAQLGPALGVALLAPLYGGAVAVLAHTVSRSPREHADWVGLMMLVTLACTALVFGLMTVVL